MNDTPKPNLLRAAAIYGLYIGLFLILCHLVTSVTGGRIGFFMQLIKLAGSIGILIYGIKRYRDIDNGGYISYGGAFGFGMLTSVCSTVLYVAYYFVMLLSNVAAIKDQLYLTFDDFVERGLVSDEAMTSFSTVVENIEWVMPLFLTLWSMLFGLIYSLIISAAIMRKRSVFES